MLHTARITRDQIGWIIRCGRSLLARFHDVFKVIAKRSPNRYRLIRVMRRMYIDWAFGSYAAQVGSQDGDFELALVEHFFEARQLVAARSG